ncbi:MAG: hypothetical protein WCH39_13945 [Schlesneria sp.]
MKDHHRIATMGLMLELNSNHSGHSLGSAFTVDPEGLRYLR